MTKQTGIILGISGKIGSGKDFVTQYIIKSMPQYSFQAKSFAYNLKHISAIISGMPVESMFTHEGKNTVLDIYDGITVGRLQQLIGTELFRDNFDKEVWVKSLFAPFDVEMDNWIVSDVRFVNEAEYIKNIGGILIRLEGDPAGVRASSTRDMCHPSETELDGYDGFDIIYNTEPGEEKLGRLVALLEQIVPVQLKLSHRGPLYTF